MRDISLKAGEGFSPSRNHTDSNKNILLTHSKWRLNQVQLQVFKGYRGKSFEAPGQIVSFQVSVLAGSDIADRLLSRFYRHLPTKAGS